MLVEQMKNSSEVSQPAIYRQASELGYLDEEVNALLDILKARGMVNQKQEGGVDYFYLVETSINFAELETKLKGIEEGVTLAEKNGFQYHCNDLSSARVLTGTLGIENNEVQKDQLRQNLNSAEVHLNNKCEEWLNIEDENLGQKIHLLETLHLQIPAVLDEQSGHPTTEFSTILFRSVQSEVKSAYTKISNRIQKIQTKIRETRDREVLTYQTDQTPRQAIETASRLQKACSRIDTDIEELNQERKNAEELHRLFEPWRMLARQIDGDKQLMDNSPEDSAVQNLITRFDVLQQGVRDHLGNKRISLKDVLGNHEHFKAQVDEIKAEFDQYLGGKEKSFIADQANIEKLIAKVIDTPHVGIKWNPADSEGCYRETREKAIEKLRDVIHTAQTQLDDVKRALLGPIETYAVPDLLKSSALELRQDIEEYAKEFQEIRSSLITENVDLQLSDWVSNLASLRQKGEGIRKRWKKIEGDMTGFRNQLSPSTQRLHDVVNPLLDDGTFNSPIEIIERLKELYQLH